MTDPNRTSEVCMWCDQTLAQHRDSGPMAKMPCGGLKRGFIAEIGSKLFSETSVGDVPAPLMIDTQFGKVEVVADPSMRTGDAPKFVQMPTAIEQTVYATIAEACTKSEAVGAKHERAAVVKYLRACSFGSGSVPYRLADDIEKGEHLK